MAKTCDRCGSNEIVSVTFASHQAEMSRQDRTIKRLIFVVIVAILLMFLSNAVWLYAWLQYDYSCEEIIVDSGNGSGNGSGNANYIGRDGRIVNGQNSGEEAE